MKFSTLRFVNGMKTEFLALQELLAALEDWEDVQAAKVEDEGMPSLSLEQVKQELGLS